MIRIAGAVHGLSEVVQQVGPRQVPLEVRLDLVFLLGDGGGLDVKPPASRADNLDIDEPQGANPLREPLHLAVLSSPIPPHGRATSV